MPETTSKEELARHPHQALFSPMTATLKQAAKEFESFKTFLGLDEETVKKMPVSMATYKGHFNRVCKGFQSTHRDNQKVKEARAELDDAIPTQFMGQGHEKDMDVFCCAALADKTAGTTHSDVTGRFPVRSLKNMQCVFVCCAHQPNAILVRPVRNRDASEHMEACVDVCNYLKQRGFTPTLNMLANVPAWGKPCIPRTIFMQTNPLCAFSANPYCWITASGMRSVFIFTHSS